MRAIVIGLLVTVGTLGLIAVRVAWQHAEDRRTDLGFESSDGLWSDKTDKFKGRTFYHVLWSFEAYKLSSRNPAISLVRVSGAPVAGAPEDAISHGSPSGKAKGIVHAMSETDRAEVTRRTQTEFARLAAAARAKQNAGK